MNRQKQFWSSLSKKTSPRSRLDKAFGQVWPDKQTKARMTIATGVEVITGKSNGPRGLATDDGSGADDENHTALQSTSWLSAIGP